MTLTISLVLLGAAISTLSYCLGYWRGRLDLRRELLPELKAIGELNDETLEHVSKLKKELPPQVPPTSTLKTKGACGIGGCPNQRPHSHVMDLARRIKEKR